MSVEVVPVTGLPEFVEGDDLAAALAPLLRDLGIVSGDVVVVTQKAVSKTEGRVVHGERATWIARETRRVLARRGDLVIAETSHGFVCANAGVDGSNVPAGRVALLPEDPDGSAARIRSSLEEHLGVRLGVIITDTFGRAWRRGVVNVAIGCAGLPALVDLRGTVDANGRELDATVIALADEIAAASGLVMGKADRVPAAIARGVTLAADPLPASELIRPPEEDLFRGSPLMSISARRTIRSFASEPVPRDVIEDAVRAACTAPAPHHTRPWLFVVVTSAAARRTLLVRMASAWEADLAADGVAAGSIRRRLARSDALLGTAPLLIVPFVSTVGAHAYPDDERANAEREMFLLSAGAAIQNLLLAFHAQGYGSAWVSSTIFCKEEARAALDIDRAWDPMGAVVAGKPAGDEAPPRPDLDLSAMTIER